MAGIAIVVFCKNDTEEENAVVEFQDRRGFRRVHTSEGSTLCQHMYLVDESYVGCSHNHGGEDRVIVFEKG